MLQRAENGVRHRRFRELKQHLLGESPRDGGVIAIQGILHAQPGVGGARVLDLFPRPERDREQAVAVGLHSLRHAERDQVRDQDGPVDEGRGGDDRVMLGIVRSGAVHASQDDVDEDVRRRPARREDPLPEPHPGVIPAREPQRHAAERQQVDLDVHAQPAKGGEGRAAADHDAHDAEPDQGPGDRVSQLVERDDQDEEDEEIRQLLGETRLWRNRARDQRCAHAQQRHDTPPCGRGHPGGDCIVITKFVGRSPKDAERRLLRRARSTFTLVLPPPVSGTTAVDVVGANPQFRDSAPQQANDGSLSRVARRGVWATCET